MSEEDIATKAESQRNVLNVQLKLLGDQKSKLQILVELIKTILIDGQHWTSSRDTSETYFLEMTQKIKNASKFIAQKCLEISSENSENGSSPSLSDHDEQGKCSPTCNNFEQSILKRLAALEASISSTQTLELSLEGSSLHKMKAKSSYLNLFNEKSNNKHLFKDQDDMGYIIATDQEEQNEEVSHIELVSRVTEMGQFIRQLQLQVDGVTNSVASLNESTLTLTKPATNSELTLESVNRKTLDVEESLDSYQHRNGESSCSVRSRLNNKSRVEEIVQDLSLKFEILSAQVQHGTRGIMHVEDPQANTHPAFTTFICSYSPVEQGTNIRSFTDVRCNYGGHFNASTGEFTAPVSGVYAVSLTLVLLRDGRVKVNVINTTADGLRERKVCETYTCGANISSSSFGVTEMEAGSRLSVKLVFLTGNSMLSDFSSFSCFRVG